jgi:hypothetical protein
VHATNRVHTHSMPGWGSMNYFYGPVVAFSAVGLLILLLRWAFSRGHSLIAAPARPGTADSYGLLVAVASPPSFIEGEIMRRSLEDSGIKTNLASTLDGPRLMVFPRDEERARAVLSRGRAL